MLPILNTNTSLTYEQFMEVSESIKDNTGYRTEYSNGKIYYFSPNLKHGKSIHNIVNILEGKLPNSCMVASELHIRFENDNYKVPDVSVFCGKDIKEKAENDTLHLEIPKLIFEVLSDSTEENDKKHKMSLYARYGIEEYLIVDYKSKTVEQYCLNGEVYQLNKIYNENDLCTLLLYPEVNFITGEIFKLFPN